MSLPFDTLITRRNATNTGFETILVTKDLNTQGVGPTLVGTQNTTLTAAALLSGVINHTVITGAATDTLDTGANIIAALTALLGVAPPVGYSFSCKLVNTAATALAITLAVAAGATIQNVAQTIPQACAATLTVTVTGAATVCVFIG